MHYGKALSPLFCYILATATFHASAAEGINKCRDRSGRLIYTDEPCEEMKAKPLRMKEAHINTLPRSAFVGTGTQPSPRSALDVADFSRLPIPGLLSNRPTTPGMSAQTPAHMTTQAVPGTAKPPETPWYQRFIDLF